MKYWPNTPEDAKSLYISMIGGLVVALIILSRDVMDILFSTRDRNFTLVALYIILFFIFFDCLKRYSVIRSGLDNITRLIKKK